MQRIHIQKVRLLDITLLQKIGRDTFQEAFSKKNTQENMEKYLSEQFSIEKLTTELNNPYSEFYFATLDQQVIGYLKLNFGHSQTELQDENSLEIERIYVSKEFYGKHVGQLLYEHALQIASQKKLNYIWLGVWEENPRAIHFYKKNGFVAFGKHIFTLGNEEQTDIMMRLYLENS